MNRRTLLSTIAGFFVGKKVVQSSVIPLPPGTDCAWNGQEWVGVGLGEHEGIEGPSGPVGMPEPIGCCGHQGPCDCQKETEAEHAQRWADAEEWNRRWDARQA